jgi:succinate dehydrogenase / fumarate reductase iron-sulfur subunit
MPGTGADGGVENWIGTSSRRMDMTTSASKTEMAVEVAPAPTGHGQIVKPGRLPVTEFAFDRAGAASPFGDDIRFPLPVESLTYVHPQPDADPPASRGEPSHH